jgi:hypothetical protein
VINGALTEACPIEKGTRQGCPLSPLLFILTLEVLLIRIRESEKLKGICVKHQDYRLRAFADDLVVTLTHPLQSMQTFLDILLQYGRVSGFKINKSKSKVLVKNMSALQKMKLQEFMGIEIVNKVKYLGVYLAASNVKLFKNNYEVLWNNVKRDMESWKKLQLSFLGRIAAVKMNILPKFLFLFQMIPILKKDDSLEEWQRGINKFVWAGKKPRVKLKIIQDERERGGLKMPNLKLYYDAVALSAISYWLNMVDARLLYLEGWDLYYGWHAYLLFNKKVDSCFSLKEDTGAAEFLTELFIQLIEGDTQYTCSAIYTIPPVVRDQ